MDEQKVEAGGETGQQDRKDVKVVEVVVDVEVVEDGGADDVGPQRELIADKTPRHPTDRGRASDRHRRLRG
jgi:hypothetical protein